MAKKTFRFRVDAGKATPGPPIGQALGPTGGCKDKRAHQALHGHEGTRDGYHRHVD